MSNTKQRIIVGAVMGLIVLAAAGLQYLGVPAVKYLGIIIVLGMIVEMVLQFAQCPRKVLMQNKNWLIFTIFLAWLLIMLMAVSAVATRPWIMLLLLMIICSADIGAWFFGKLIGGDKMWERMSANKTWAGQIAGILCGTFAAVMYGLLGTDTFLPQLMWIGIGVSLMSQYGDLTASFIKRRMGLKDFGTIFPGHGGFLDRFDGWIYALPVVWWVIL